MVQPKYTPEEKLERIKLMFKYDLNKTLNENREIILEQDANEYYKTVVRQILNQPEQASKTFGITSNDKTKKAAEAIKKGVEGFDLFGKIPIPLGTDFDAVNYAIDNGFSDIKELVGLSSDYKKIGGESLFDALNGEIFSRGLSRIDERGKEFVSKFCAAKPKIEICKIKSREETQYGF